MSCCPICSVDLYFRTAFIWKTTHQCLIHRRIPCYSTNLTYSQIWFDQFPIRTYRLSWMLIPYCAVSFCNCGTTLSCSNISLYHTGLVPLIFTDCSECYSLLCIRATVKCTGPTVAYYGSAEFGMVLSKLYAADYFGSWLENGEP